MKLSSFIFRTPARNWKTSTSWWEAAPRPSKTTPRNACPSRSPSDNSRPSSESPNLWQRWNSLPSPSTGISKKPSDFSRYQFQFFILTTATMLGITSSNVRDHFTRKKKFFPFWQWYYRAFNRQLRIWYIDHLQNFAGTVQMLRHNYILYVWRIRWWPNFNYLWFCDKIVD